MNVLFFFFFPCNVRGTGHVCETKQGVMRGRLRLNYLCSLRCLGCLGRLAVTRRTPRRHKDNTTKGLIVGYKVTNPQVC